MKLHCPFCGIHVATVLSLPGLPAGGWFAITAERFPGGGPASFLIRLVVRETPPGQPIHDREVFATRQHPGLCEGRVVT